MTYGATVPHRRPAPRAARRPHRPARRPAPPDRRAAACPGCCRRTAPCPLTCAPTWPARPAALPGAARAAASASWRRPGSPAAAAPPSRCTASSTAVAAARPSPSWSATAPRASPPATRTSRCCGSPRTWCWTGCSWPPRRSGPPRSALYVHRNPRLHGAAAGRDRRTGRGRAGPGPGRDHRRAAAVPGRRGIGAGQPDQRRPGHAPVQAAARVRARRGAAARPWCRTWRRWPTWP